MSSCFVDDRVDARDSEIDEELEKNCSDLDGDPQNNYQHNIPN
jgi:hypothetical protein